MEKKLTIIVPIYKIDEKELRFCIDSLINQTDNRYDVILVDDGSPDQSGVICDQYTEAHDFITVIHQENICV